MSEPTGQKPSDLADDVEALDEIIRTIKNALDEVQAQRDAIAARAAPEPSSEEEESA